MKRRRSEIREDLLTLEDAALVADEQGQLPRDTEGRVRRLVRSDPRVTGHFDYLEELADEARMPETSERLHVGFQCLEELERLEQAADWRHPAEVLDPTGEIGIPYRELLQLAGMRARQAAAPERYRSIERKLERAWSVEKEGEALAERFAERLCAAEPATAERLLRHATRQYRARRRRGTRSATGRVAESQPALIEGG